MYDSPGISKTVYVSKNNVVLWPKVVELPAVIKA